MSDKTEREYRQNMLTILDRFYRGRGGSLLTKDECEAMEYAISSIKTDLKYDLLYEETKHIANVSKKIEPTTKNDLGVDCVDRREVINRIFYSTDNSGDVVLGSALRERIERLPSVTPQEPILDKIRAEIMGCLKALDEIEKSGLNIYLPNEISGRRLTYQQCLKFIDKYKAESEKA